MVPAIVIVQCLLSKRSRLWGSHKRGADCKTDPLVDKTEDRGYPMKSENGKACWGLAVEPLRRNNIDNQVQDKYDCQLVPEWEHNLYLF